MSTVSFVMPAWKAGFLEDAVSSILAQSSPDWELVVVDDCSPEDLGSIVAKFADPRIRYVRNEENLGSGNLVRQWNHCLTQASGEWLVLAADDDVYAPDFCKEILTLAGKYPEVDLIRARVELIDSDGRQLWGDGEFPEVFTGTQYLEEWMAGHVFTCVGNFAFRREALVAAGGFKDFPCAFCSDVATPLLLSGNGVANTREIGFFFRNSGVNLSGDRSRVLDKMEATQQFFEWLRGFAPALSRQWIHEKCLYDCYNLAVRFASPGELPAYLRACREAGWLEKVVMTLRWAKDKIL